jgi:hypothetical protein
LAFANSCCGGDALNIPYIASSKTSFISQEGMKLGNGKRKVYHLKGMESTSKTAPGKPF